MDNPLAELEAWWNDAYDDGGAGTTLVEFNYSYRGEGIDSIETYQFSLEAVDDMDARSSWLLDVKDCLEIDWRGPEGDLTWHQEHPILIPHEDRTGRISFAKPFDDPNRVWGAVARAHRELVCNWFPLGRYFREDMIDQRFGILAEGPERLMLVYQESLSEMGADTGLSTNERRYDRYADSPPVSIVTWGESFFVARSYKLSRTA
jgi:hypothetical protein